MNDSIINSLTSEVNNGNKKALRDLATFLDKPTSRNKALNVLKKYCLFRENEFDLVGCQRNELISFLYENYERIKFDESLRIFFITPPEDQNTAFYVKRYIPENENEPNFILKKLKSEWYEAKAKNDESLMIKLLGDAEDLKLPQTYDWLREILKYQKLGTQYSKVYDAAILELQNEISYHNIILIHQCYEQHITSYAATDEAMSRLVNNQYENIELYIHNLDSIGNLDKMRMIGYHKWVTFRIEYFTNPVDFFGKILNNEAFPNFIRKNAIKDMLATQHPRSLYYIATQVWQGIQDYDYVNLLKRITLREIGFIDRFGGVSYDIDKKDIYTQRNFLRYWSAHYQDYEWDGITNTFSSKADFESRTSDYEKLFKRLGASNDTIAIKAMMQLVESDPKIVKQLREKLMPIIRNLDPKIPSLQYPILENIAELTSFCRKNKINYSLNTSLFEKLNGLHHISPIERYAIENELTHRLTLEDITAFEIASLSHIYDEEFAFSSGKILDKVYSKYWNQISDKEVQLRLFLKKSTLYKNIGLTGIGNQYLNKINPSDSKLKQKLINIKKNEVDFDIVDAINLFSKSAKLYESDASLIDFINHTEDYNERIIRNFVKPDKQDIDLIVKRLQSDENPLALALLIEYLNIYKDIEMMPSIMKMIEIDKEISYQNQTIKIKDIAHKWLVEIYNYDFQNDNPKESWSNLWMKDSTNSQEWFNYFFKEKVNYLQESKSLNVEDINIVVKSKYYTDDYKDLCLNAIQKIQNKSEIKRLEFKTKLSQEDLHYFENIHSNGSELDDILKLFEFKNDSIFWNFVNKNIYNYNTEELGAFYNDLFKVPYFIDLLAHNMVPKVEAEKIQKSLNKYLISSSNISAYEEQVTFQHIINIGFIDNTINESLQKVNELETEESIKNDIFLQILSHVQYKDLGKVVAFGLLNENKSTFLTTYLNEYFGIPLFNPQKSDLKEFISLHKALPEKGLYMHYLERFGIQLFQNGNLDIQLVYDMFNYEMVTPFLGSGGQRDYFVYAVIKVLEKEFNTTLGYHEKLNENQNLFHFSAQKRATSWMQYLIKEKGFKVNNMSISFNRTLTLQ